MKLKQVFNVKFQWKKLAYKNRSKIKIKRTTKE